MRLAACVLGVGCLLAAVDVAHAHARSESYSNWNISDDRMVGVITVSTGEVMTLMDTDQPGSPMSAFAGHVARTVRVDAANGACAAAPPVPLASARGFLRLEVSFRCDGLAPVSLDYRALFDRLPAHVHFIRIFDEGSLVAEQVMTDRASRWQRSSETGRHSFGAFLDLGIAHILSGIDHIAFLLGMLLVAGTFGRAIVAVTGFTLGHSLSLAGAVLGYVQANGRLVEAFIGFTVALVAVEYFYLRRTRARALPVLSAAAAWLTGAIAAAADLVPPTAALAYLGFGVFAFCHLLAAARLSRRGTTSSGVLLLGVTTCFGLIHGFGFAGFLLDTGLGGTSLAVALLGFNLGVEAGQLALVGVAFVLAHLLRNTRVERLAPFAAATLCGVGVFWFVGRSLAV